MKIRTQLVLVCFLLAVLPLTAIVVYSYSSSRDALETAYHGEAKRLTAQMDRRLALIRSDLEQRLAEVSALPSLSGANSQQTILATMGDAASLVDSIEIRPLPVPPQARVAEAPQAPRPESPKPATPKPAVVVATNLGTDIARRVVRELGKEGVVDDSADDDNGKDDGGDEDEVPTSPMMIDLPAPAHAAMRFTMTDEQRAQLDTMRRLGQELGMRWNQLSPTERDAMQKQLADAQSVFEKTMKERTEAFNAQVAATVKARETARAVRHQVRLIEHRPPAVPPVPPVAPTTVPSVPVPPVASVAATAAPAAVTAPAPPPAPVAHRVSDAERVRLTEGERQTTLVFGQKFDIPLRQKGQVVGQIQAHVSNDEVIRRVLGVESEDRSEIAFALDRDGNLYTRTAEDKATLTNLGVPQRVANNQPLSGIPNWIVVLNRDVQSGLRIGVARPVGETFEQLRKTAAKNFGFGMAVVLFLLFGITPIANHVTRDVKAVTRGAERVAQGDLMTRVPVTSTKSEFGQLAAAFNRMAEDLSMQQQRIVTQERERQEQALQQRLLEVEYSRKSEELEEARRFQLSLLPKHVPLHDDFELAVFTRTATEVGGDYYDFHHGANGVLSAAIGDATGHGARAGTMVTVIKALFAGYASDAMPSAFLRDAAEKVKRMDLPRMAMALIVAKLERNRVTVTSAGMPPVYVHRAASGTVDEISLHATPLGTLGADYRDAVIDLAAGDTMLLMTDGFPELLNAAGQQLGYIAAQQEFAAAAAAPDAQSVIAALEAAAERWHGDAPPNDDVTFVVVRARK